MPLRNEKAYQNSFWDWYKMFKGCFGRSKCEVGDIDGIMERHGNFIVVESKGLHSEIPKGQQILFNELYKLGCFTIVVIYGEKHNVSYMEWKIASNLKINNENKRVQKKIKANNDTARGLMSRWWEKVNKVTY